MTGHSQEKRRGNALILVTMSMLGICSIGALGLDICRLQLLRHELQAVVDSAALAAGQAVQAVSDPGSDYVSVALDAASMVAAARPIDGQIIDFARDGVEIGMARHDPDPDGPLVYAEADGRQRPNAVRVSGSVPLTTPIFSPLFNGGTRTVAATASAAILSVDVVLIYDASFSMGDRSRISNAGVLDPDGPNTRDIWAALPNSPGAPGYNPNTAGPTFGYFQDKSGFGVELIDSSYAPSSDPGLVYLPVGQSWNDKKHRKMLAEQGYNELEINVLVQPVGAGPLQMQGELSRVAVAMGWVGWSSGLGPDAGSKRARWELEGWPRGNMDASIGQPDFDSDGIPDWVDGGPITGTNELLKLVPCPYPNDGGNFYNTWKFFALMNSNPMNNPLQHYYGLKSYVEYLLQNFNTIDRMPQFAVVPQLPLQWFKDASNSFLIEQGLLGTYDHVGVEAYSDEAYHVIDLIPISTGAATVAGAINQGMQPGMNDMGRTNIQAGIVEGHTTLTTRVPTHAQGVPPRALSTKLMLIMSDGQPSRCLELLGYDSDGRSIYGASTDDCGAYVWTDPGTGTVWSGAQAAALHAAQEAADQGVRFHTMSVQPLLDAPPAVAFMETLARIGGGQHFSVDASPRQLESALDLAYNTKVRAPVILFD